jgi:amino acid adenylation domain-containing protein
MQLRPQQEKIAVSSLSQQQAIRDKCFHPSGAFVEFKREEIEQSIPERFERIVRQYPNRLAVTTQARPRGLTYEELNDNVNRIAGRLVDACGEQNEPVAIFIEKEEIAIAAILGALKAGKIYVPVDPSAPQEKIVSILEDCQARFMVADSMRQPIAQGLCGNRYTLINVDELANDNSGTNPSVAVAPDRLAFILYTSGTTGSPKGIVQNHRNVLHSIRAYTNDIHLCPDDRLTLLFSLSFHGAVRNFLGALLNGGSVHCFDPKKGSLNELITWMISQEITVYHSSATLFRNFAPLLSGKNQRLKLRIVQLAAEAVVAGDVELFRRFFPQTCIFSNRLGTTETGTYLRFQMDINTPLAGSSVPVGYPVDGMHVFLVDEEGKEVGRDVVGEIAVNGRYLAPGYWRRPDLTNSTFVSDASGSDERTYFTGDMGRMDSDDCFFHLGRKDFQVKIRGFRVGLGELETALLNHPGIKEVAVVSLNKENNEERLVAYFVPVLTEPVPKISELRSFLREKLPDYMIPSAFMLLDKMPLTPNGKIDRKALPPPDRGRPELDTTYVLPRTPLERQLAELWATVLGLDRVGIYDNFFDLGGHSIAASRVVSHLMQALQLEIPLQSLLRSPTIAEMAEVITRGQTRQLSETELNGILAELDSLSDEQARQVVAQGQGGKFREKRE